jgi:hypothetical protein
MEEELEVLKKLYHGTFQDAELVDIFYRYKDKYRVMVSLLQQPRFPEKHALGIIPKLFPIDLLRVAKNSRTNPNTRKRVEIEFAAKFPRFPLGEKLSYLKIAPYPLLHYFIEQTDARVLDTILQNPNVTEDLVLKFINRNTERFSFYETLCNSEWYKRPRVAEAVSLDTQAPVKIMVMIIPFLNLKNLERLFKDENTHGVVKQNILRYLETR